MGEPIVGMRFGNYTTSMNKLKSEYAYKKETTGRKQGYFFDKQNKVVARENFDFYSGGMKARFFIENDGVVRFGTSSIKGERNFNKIIGEKTYAQDEAINPDYKAEQGEVVKPMKDGIVQPWEIFDRNY